MRDPLLKGTGSRDPSLPMAIALKDERDTIERIRRVPLRYAVPYLGLQKFGQPTETKSLNFRAMTTTTTLMTVRTSHAIDSSHLSITRF